MNENQDPGVSVTASHSIAAGLPGLIDLVLTRYRDFASAETPNGAKAFAAYSTACRAALQHLDLLLRLARSLDARAPGGAPAEDDIARIIARAERALADADKESR